MAEIDTPERRQPWGSRAKQALSGKVFRENVEVRVRNTDRYGRTVGHVWIGDRHINREMIREGHAWVYRRYLDDETHARENKLGLWGLPEAQRVPPWEWRRGKRIPELKLETSPDQEFSCSMKRRCSEMVSCAEARFYLEKCARTRLDGDGDRWLIAYAPRWWWIWYQHFFTRKNEESVPNCVDAREYLC